MLREKQVAMFNQFEGVNEFCTGNVHRGVSESKHAIQMSWDKNYCLKVVSFLNYFQSLATYKCIYLLLRSTLFRYLKVFLSKGSDIWLPCILIFI